MSCDDVNTRGKQGPWGLGGAVVCLFVGLVSLAAPFDAPWTSWQGFSSDAVPTINDRGDIDCGGSSLSVVLHGPRVNIRPGDLARRAETACRDDAVVNVSWGVIGLALVVLAGSRLVLRARRYRARRRAKGPGDGGERVVPGRLLERKQHLRSPRLTDVRRR